MTFLPCGCALHYVQLISTTCTHKTHRSKNSQQDSVRAHVQLSCVYLASTLRHNACDKMYQALPDLSQESLETRLGVHYTTVDISYTVPIKLAAARILNKTCTPSVIENSTSALTA